MGMVTICCCCLEQSVQEQAYELVRVLLAWWAKSMQTAVRVVYLCPVAPAVLNQHSQRRALLLKRRHALRDSHRTRKMHKGSAAVVMVLATPELTHVTQQQTLEGCMREMTELAWVLHDILEKGL